MDLFLHKLDIDHGLEYLDKIEIVDDNIISESLFLAALNSYLKCFKKNKSRSSLDKNVIANGDSETLDAFFYFESLRDKHYMHDENKMISSVAFLLVNPEESNEMIDSASVVWTVAKINFKQASIILKQLMNVTINYLVYEIDRVGYLIKDQYKELSREQLFEFGEVNLILANTDNLSQNRTGSN